MNKGMAMVAIDELKKAREEAIKFAQETDNASITSRRRICIRAMTV